MAFQEGDRVVLVSRYAISNGVSLKSGLTGTVVAVEVTHPSPDETVTNYRIDMDELVSIYTLDENAELHFVRIES